MSTNVQTDSDKIFLTDDSGGVLVIAPMGNLPSLNWVELESASLGVVEMVSQHPEGKVLVDLTFLEFCGSTLLGIIMRIWTKVTQAGGTMVLCQSSPQISQLLKLTQLDKLWTIYPSREAARLALLGTDVA